jgi:hypothetical protein
MRRPGCPICRCHVEHEVRYLHNLLWENINDVETRMRLALSLGLCGRHAVQMLAMERTEFRMLLGNSIIYESLVGLVRGRLREVQATLAARRLRPSRLGAWLAAWGIRWPNWRWRPDRPLAPTRRCRACELADEMARHDGEVLAQMLGQSVYQELYASSDGVCLPHLRDIVASASMSPGVAFLLTETERRLAPLQQEMESLGESHRVILREGVDRTLGTRSVEQAIAFLTGFASHVTREQ